MPRLDSQLAELFPNYSRSVLQKFIKDGRVLVDGVTERRPSAKVNNEQIDFFEPVRDKFEREIEDFARHIIYQDDNVVVLDKPAGVLVHAKGGLSDEFTVSDYIKSQFNDEIDPLNNRQGIVHRLDRATSGVMICAKNNKTASFLSRQFAERKTKKTYYAVVAHTPKNPTGKIDLPIRRNLKKPATFCVGVGGKPAVTNYEVMRENPDGTAVVRLQPQTGRTHQLRVHLAYIGCPIVGDPIYNPNPGPGRLLLHSSGLEITLPGKAGEPNRRCTFIADLPPEFNYDLKEKLDARA